MDNSASRERPDGNRVHQYLTYLAFKVGYQKLRATPGFKVLQWPTQVHPKRDGFLGHLLIGRCFLICYQNRVEILSSEIRGSLRLQIHYNKRMVKVALDHRTK
jgi:hypothetical protein